MKKLLTLLLATVLMLSCITLLSACGDSAETETDTVTENGETEPQTPETDPQETEPEVTLDTALDILGRLCSAVKKAVLRGV